MKYYIIILLTTLSLAMAGQCDMDRHNTNLESGWISCDVSPNPNPARGTGHWMMYDFSFSYQLEQLHIWNYNHPDYLNRGANQLIVDVSEDGQNWIQAASFSVAMASGNRLYGGVDGPILNRRARYMLVTVASNHGGNCYALSEVRVGVADEINCQDNYIVDGVLPNKKYYAHQSINTAGTAGANTIVHMQAGNQVLLNQGFETAQTAELQIDMGPCDQ